MTNWSELPKLLELGYTYSEIAAKLKTTRSAVAGRIYRMRKGAYDKHPNEKIPRDEIPYIYAMHEEGISIDKIAKKYGVCSVTIYNILTGSRDDSRRFD